MENGCNDQRSATGSWHQDAIGLLHPRLIANSDRPELQNTRLIMTCLNIQDAEETQTLRREEIDYRAAAFLRAFLAFAASSAVVTSRSSSGGGNTAGIPSAS